MSGGLFSQVWPTATGAPADGLGSHSLPSKSPAGARPFPRVAGARNARALRVVTG